MGIFELIIFLMENGLVSMPVMFKISVTVLMCDVYIRLDKCNNGLHYILFLDFMNCGLKESSGLQLPPWAVDLPPMGLDRG